MGLGLVIINRRSGGAESARELGALAAESVRARGLEPRVAIVEPGRLGAALGAAKRGAAELLVIGGGDGTLRSAAERAASERIPLALLPLGTMNLFAKDLGVSMDPAIAAASIATATVERVDLGSVGGRVFLHSAVLGVVPRIGGVRERARGRRDVGSLLRSVRRLGGVFARERPLGLDLEVDGERRSVSTFMLAVSVNRLRGTVVGSLGRESMRAGELGVYWSTHAGRAGLLRLLGELGTGLWGLDDRVEHRAGASVVVHTGGRARVSIDGEIERLSGPLRFGVHPGALAVLAPRGEGEACA